MGHAQTRDAHTSHKHGTKRELTAMEFGLLRGEYCMSSRGVFCDATLVARRTSVASQKTPRDDMQYASLGTLSAEPANAT